MRKKIAIMFASLLLISCNRNSTAFVLNEEREEKIGTFILQGTKFGNNMSDEEMEDVIIELRRTAIKLYCPEVPVIVDKDNIILSSPYGLEKGERFLQLY